MFRIVLTGLIPVLLAAISGAQQSPIITETEYLSVLNEAHPAVREAASAVTSAEARIHQSSIVENPVFSATREEPSDSMRQTEFLISWQVPGISRGLKIRVYEEELEAANARFNQKVLTHRLAMREAYANWAISEYRQRRLSDQAKRVERLASRVAARSEKGEASGLEAHRLRLAASAFRSQVALAVTRSEQARGEASVWYPDLPSDAHPALPALPDAPPSTQTNDPVRAAEADLLAAELGREAAGRFLRSPEVSLGWQQQEDGPLSIDGPIVGLAWSIPLFNRNRAARESADAAIERARARLELVESEVNASRSSALKNYARLSAAVTRAQLELETSERVLDGAEAAFDLGESSLTDLLETHRLVADARMVLLSIHQEALATHRELERFTGPTKLTLPAHLSSNDNSTTLPLSQENTP